MHHACNAKPMFQGHRLCALAGFTLVEMVVVILLIGILSAMSLGFIKNAIFGYVSTEQRVALVDMADNALRKINHDIHNALPNSARVTSDGVNTYLEFVPLLGGGRYRSGTNDVGIGDPLQFNLADTSFDVLGAPVSIAAGSKLVIYNLGIDGADVYQGANVASILSTGNSLSNLTFASKTFSLTSPNSRFFVVKDASSYVCDLPNRRLLYYTGYTIQPNQPSSIAVLNGLATVHVVTDNVTSCFIEYSPGILQRSGVVTIQLELSTMNGVVKLVNIMNVVNSP